LKPVIRDPIAHQFCAQFPSPDAMRNAFDAAHVKDAEIVRRIGLKFEFRFEGIKAAFRRFLLSDYESPLGI
jgi:hypothetical protein